MERDLMQRDLMHRDPMERDLMERDLMQQDLMERDVMERDAMQQDRLNAWVVVRGKRGAPTVTANRMPRTRPPAPLRTGLILGGLLLLAWIRVMGFTFVVHIFGIVAMVVFVMQFLLFK